MLADRLTASLVPSTERRVGLRDLAILLIRLSVFRTLAMKRALATERRCPTA
jgi:hypothetical protein